MAKGDDGNYLQHSIELAAASRLTAANPAALHVALAHGMAPFEPFERKFAERAPGLVRCRVKAALKLAAAPPRCDEPPIVTAYRKANTSEEHYPNSAELLRTLRVGERPCGLHGGISEICPEKHERLAAAWAGSSLRTARTSWRQQVRSGGVLACPERLQTPWLFSMDPTTYREDASSDDDNLHKHDIMLLAEALPRYVESGQPGMAALFVYNVRPEQQCQFWEFVDELAQRTGTGAHRHSLTHRGGNRNLAALLYSSIDVPEDFLQDAVEEIEDVALVNAIRESEREYSTWEAASEILGDSYGDSPST